MKQAACPHIGAEPGVQQFFSFGGVIFGFVNGKAPGAGRLLRIRRVRWKSYQHEPKEDCANSTADQRVDLCSFHPTISAD